MATNNTRQAIWISLGSLASTLIAVISPMILSRYLTKGDYGTYKQVMYIYTSLLLIFTLGLPKSYSYFIPKVDISEAKDLINKITRIFYIMGGCFSIFLFIGAPIIADLLKNDELNYALKLFSVVPFLLLPTMGLEGIYASFQKTHIVAIYTIITKSLTVLLSVFPVVFFDGGYKEAIIGFNIGCFISFVLAVCLKTKLVKKSVNKYTHITYKDIFAFSIPLMSASIWGMIINSSDQFFISRYFGTEEFADFSNGFMELPFITMILSSIITVLLPVFSRLSVGDYNKEKLLEIWMSTLNKSVKIIYPMAIFCIVFAKPIMTCLYGDLYANSGIYFAIKNIQALFVVMPFSPIILALGKTKEYAKAHFITALIVVISEFVAVLFFKNPYSVAIVSDICQFIKVILQFMIVLAVLKFSIGQMIDFKVIGKLILTCLIACVTPLAVNCCFNIQNKWILMILDCILFIAFYYLLCFLFKVSYKEIFKGVFSAPKFQKIINIIP